MSSYLYHIGENMFLLTCQFVCVCVCVCVRARVCVYVYSVYVFGYGENWKSHYLLTSLLTTFWSEKN